MGEYAVDTFAFGENICFFFCPFPIYLRIRLSLRVFSFFTMYIWIITPCTCAYSIRRACALGTNL